MNAIAQGQLVTKQQPYDVSLLREIVRAALAERGGAVRPTALNDLINNRRQDVKPKATSRPRGTYSIETINKDGEREVKQKRKPGYGQWSTTSHATATRRAGFSRELGEFGEGGKVYNAHALWELHTTHIASLLARYSDNRKERNVAANALADIIADRFRVEKVKDRARIMAFMLLHDRSLTDIRQAIRISQKEWRGSNARRTYYMVSEALERMDEGALLAWQDRCWRAIRT